MITESASLRRSVVDQVAFSLFFDHLENFKSYEKIIANRNQILKNQSIDQELLTAFTQMMIDFGAEIISKRMQAIEAINPGFESQNKFILGNDNSSELIYNPSWINFPLGRNLSAADIKGFLQEKYLQVKEQEFFRRTTLFGPHLDDIDFMLNSKNARKTCSRGQARSLVLALKLSHISALVKQNQLPPIILLDDIISELDHQRAEKLLSSILDLNTQVFLTATDLEKLQPLSGQAAFFQVDNGVVTKICAPNI
jgi:DNA replication and repair protein RecF